MTHDPRQFCYEKFLEFRDSVTSAGLSNRYPANLMGYGMFLVDMEDLTRSCGQFGTLILYGGSLDPGGAP